MQSGQHFEFFPVGRGIQQRLLLLVFFPSFQRFRRTQLLDFFGVFRLAAPRWLRPRRHPSGLPW
jgi:hypothetical protein